MNLVFRPSFAGVRKEFALLGGAYLVMLVLLCVALIKWTGLVVAIVVFVVIAGLLAAVVVRTFRGTTITVTDTTVTQHHPWNRTDRVLNRSEIIRVLRFDRLKGALLPMSVLLVVDRDHRRLGGAGWLWNADLMNQVASALADERVRPEHYASVSSLQIVRDFGVDPDIKRRPVRSALVMLAAAAVGVVIAFSFFHSWF
ncbi:hypothetical protein [Kribbella sp. NPDC006257]|uniref:hypothetical protein n=1 Tax=Kribbella sp. NPDC006257 TaxID=3156738 RepID=UPI0033B3C5E3